MEQTSQALSAIATSTATQAEDVANVVVTTTNIEEQLRLAMHQMNGIHVRLTAVENFNSWSTGTGAGRGNHRGRGQPGRGASGDRGRGRGGGNNDESYCHTHGRTRRPDHTSPTCLNPTEGHISTATLHNREGGSNRFCGGNA